MMHLENTQIKHGQAAFQGSVKRADMGDDMSLAGITLVIGLASLIGFWGLTCLVSGLIKSSGVIGLGASWVAAIFGF